jgi:CheY-like chemotaxis protein
MTNSTKKVVAVVSDLMFTVKIQGAAKQAGVAVTFVSSREKALAEARLGPAAVIIDLNGKVEPLELIRTLKGDAETSHIPLIGYVSHVQADLRQAAQDAGCDIVVARSTFSEKLPSILSGSIK